MPTEEQTYREGIKKDLTDIKTMVAYTNGKVKRIILAIVLLAGIIVGQSAPNPHALLKTAVHLFVG